MTLYLDTSALVKLYIGEEHTPLVKARIRPGAALATSMLTYVEVRSALNRRRREGSYSTANERVFVTAFERDWSTMQQIEVTERLILQAGDLAARHHLRAYDAVHLASALQLEEKLGRLVTFAAFDGLLNRAAKKEGLTLLRG